MCCCKVGSISQMFWQLNDQMQFQMNGSSCWKIRNSFTLIFFQTCSSTHSPWEVKLRGQIKRKSVNKRRYLNLSLFSFFWGGRGPLFLVGLVSFLRPQLPRSPAGCANEWDGKLNWVKKSGWSGWGRTFQFCFLLMIIASFPKRPIFCAAGYAMNEDMVDIVDMQVKGMKR